ncbi:MAG: hypothetical protein FWB96_11810 [Defluviitaleaceae bacterium]|nr:hypothetical protein [Defluviitaleaceae bacterium]MCL2263773.1 hypothetical protein [Defluviitaleaceae bacterium]
MVLLVDNIPLTNGGLGVAEYVVELNDLDSKNSGRTEESGIMLREKVAEAYVITVTLTKVQVSALTTLLTVCRRPFVTIAFSNPYNEMQTDTMQFYNSTRSVGVVKAPPGGKVIYDRVVLGFIGRGTPVGGREDWTVG